MTPEQVFVVRTCSAQPHPFAMATRNSNSNSNSRLEVYPPPAIASPMSEDCCHDTSASVSNVYIAAWQEIVKPAKVIELRMFTVRSITRYVERNNGQTGQGLCVKHVSHRSNPTCSSSKELFLAISMIRKCIRGKSATVAGRKTDEYISPRSESFRYLLLLQKQLFRPHSFSQQHQT